MQPAVGAADLEESLIKDTFRHRLLPGDGVFDLASVARALRAIGALRMIGPVLSTELDAAARRGG